MSHPSSPPRYPNAVALDLRRIGCPAPWRLDTNDPAIILDADSIPVAQVDPDYRRTDAEQSNLALTITRLINAAAGFKANLPDEESAA